MGGRDVGGAERELREAYPFQDVAITPTDPTFSWQYAVSGDPIMSVRTLRMPAELRLTCSMLDTVVVVWNRTGRGVLTVDDRDVPLAPGVPVVLPTDRPFAMWHADVALSAVHLGCAFVDRVAALARGIGANGGGSDPGGPDRTRVQPPRVRFEPHRPPADVDLAAWRRVVHEIAPVLLDQREPPDAITREMIAERMARAVLRTFPHSVGPVLDLPAGRDTDRLRRAVEFVQRNAHLGIGTAEIAAAADLSPRGLQQSLRRNLGMTPNGLLRAVRLDGANADLVRSDPGTTTVADIARAWGFGHLGRFSATYRGRYDELPSETLRRTGPRAR